jgi:hypothetical protein
MDVEGWDTAPYEALKAGEGMDARYLPVEASMEISHAIRKDGSLACGDCHSPDGVLDWSALGYGPEDAEMLSMNPTE